jgi:putative transposase
VRYPASEKAEVIKLVEQSHLPAKRTLDKLGIPRATFYRWYDRFREGGIEALADSRGQTGCGIASSQIINLALELTLKIPFEPRIRFCGDRQL